ncbi:MAG: hypothetical protein HXS46_13565 [Theionarchaea archaeon]|nr:MAG: hypothetical protein AYK18_14255 [Theionarchaea archaeon DG-70]MBU7011710.1 hypothetical protein [Theionarchaea archaeon]
MKRVIIVLLLIGVCGSMGGLRSMESEEVPPKKVMIDISHSLKTANPGVNMVVISKLMVEFSFDVRNEMLTEDLVEQYDVVMLYQPHGLLEDSEIGALTTYVENGGGLIICGEHDAGWNDSSRSTYSKLASTFGIIFTSNSVDDPTHKAGCYCTPILHNMAEHPLSEGVTQIILFKPCALRISGDAVAIARGDEDTRTVGAEGIEGEDVIVVAVSEYGNGRVVVVGSYTVFDDSYINMPDNQVFAVNCFTWASEPTVLPEEGFDYTMVAAVGIIFGVLVLIIAFKKR